MSKIPFIEPDKRSPCSISISISPSSPEEIIMQPIRDKIDYFNAKLTDIKIDVGIPSSSHHIQSSVENKGYEDEDTHETEESLDKNKQGWAPLQLASRDNNANAISLLLNKEEKIQQKSLIENNTPLQIAANKGYEDKDFNLHQRETEESLDIFRKVFYKFENIQGWEPLHIASRDNNVHVIKFLLDKGEKIQQKTVIEKDTPLHIAAKHNKKDAVNCLCERGADVRLKNLQGFTSLHYAAQNKNLEICKTLIQKGCDVNAMDNEKCTPLHMAIRSCSEEVTHFLIQNNADIYATNMEGKAAIHNAAENDKGELIRLLTDKDSGNVEKNDLKKSKINYVNMKTQEKNEQSALHIAARADNINTLKFLLDFGADVNLFSGTNYTALHFAAINGNLDMTEYLLDKNAKVNVYDHELMTPAHRACQFGRINVLKLLINRGASIECNDYNYFTPLMWAVVAGRKSIVKYLIKKEANVNATDINIKNVLHLATENNSLKIMLLLIHKCNSLVNKPDKNFKRPLHYAVMKNNVKSVKLLIGNSADILAADKEEKTALHTAAEYGHCECLLELVSNKYQNVNVADNKGRSPLHLAAKKGWLEISTALVKNGAQISICDCKNFTPLDYAAKYGHHKIVLMLIENGADVNGSDVNNDGSDVNNDRSDVNNVTPIQRASINGHVKCIQTLLKHGANMFSKNKDEKNCFDLAVENRQKEACMIFIENDFSQFFVERWDAALKENDEEESNRNNQEKNLMEKLIALAPDIAKIVLDKCIQRSHVDKNLKEYSETYNFKYLDLVPMKSLRKQYFGPSTMIKYNRENLLFHPLTLQLLSDKWLRLGLWIHLISLFIYILFLCMVTSLVFVDKSREKYSQYNGLQRLTISAAVIFTVFEICKEIYQAFTLGKEYLKDLSNYLELLLYSSTLIYLASRYFYDNSYNDTIKDVKWISATIAVLLAWINLLLYLNRYTFFGIYVTMIIEVIKSLINVVLVLFFIVLGFSLSFFMLLGNQNIFRLPGRSIMKTIAMTLGESSFEEIFVDNYLSTPTDNIFNGKLPYPEMSLILFTLFLIVCAIAIINLLVGLAVGDIAEVRKSALKLMLKSQIDILHASESKCPLMLLKKIYRDKLIIYPNRISWIMRFLNWLVRLNHETVKENQERELTKCLAKDLELQLMELDNQMYAVEFRLRKNIDLAEKVGDNSKIYD